MMLANWIANNPSLLHYDVEEVHDGGVMYGVRFTQYDVGRNIKPLDYNTKCTRCIDGNYEIYDGTYGRCNRCDGQGFITEDKAIRNAVFDMKQKQELQQLIDSL